MELGILPIIPSPVVAQVSRSPRQAQLRRFLAGCVVTTFSENDAHEAGRLLGATKTSGVVDAAVVALAVRGRATILTGDSDDMSRLVSAAGRDIKVVDF